MITQLNVRAFKSLRSFNIEPKKVNLLIGANGTGKTNFADLIAFIASLSRRGLSETIASLAGLSQVRTRQTKGAPYKLQIELKLDEDRSRNIKEAYYSFTLAQSKEIKIQEEILKAVIYEASVDAQNTSRSNSIREVELYYHRKGDSLKEWSKTLGPPILTSEDERELILSSPYSSNIRILRNYLGAFRVYNIDAAIAKQSSISDELDLRRDGSNTVAFVANMLRSSHLRGQLLRDLQEVVPYIQDIRPDRLLTLQTLRFTERDTGVEFQLPEMSDGTIRLLGLLAVLHRQFAPVIVIEEPENALHAYAIHHILKIVRQVAMANRRASQIFLTSHSSTVVDEVLSVEAMRETQGQTACFITQRKPGEPSIVPAPESVIHAIAQNLGRPSDFQREGSFGDEPVQPELLEALEEE
jgi:predicted ATPase